MSIYTRPLVALSLTEPDAGLLRYASRAIDQAQCEEIRFAHVSIDPAIASQPGRVETLRERLCAEVETNFGPVTAKAAFDVVAGARVDQILGIAAKNQNDVILLGHRHGRSGRRSLARQLAMVSPSSVWLAPEGSPEKISRILVPVDFSNHSADALSHGTRLAAALGLETCIAVHVFFDPSTVRYPEHVDEVCRGERGHFDEFISKIDCHGVTVEPVFEESTHPAQAILRTVKRHDVDLIVMSTRGRTRAAAVLLGSVASETITGTSVPLLAVKHFGGRETLLQALLDRRFWANPSIKTN